MFKSTAHPIKDESILLLVVLVWGINFPIIKHALAAMHPFVINVFRFGVSCTFLGVMLMYRNRRRENAVVWSEIRPHAGTIVFLGLLGYVLYQVFFILGIYNTTSGNSALIMASSPTWTAIIAYLFIQERLRGMAWLGLMLSLAGTAFVVLDSGKAFSLDASYLTGNLLTVGAAATWGAYTALSKPMTRHIDPLVLTFLGLLVAFPLIIAIAIPYFEQIEWSLVTFWVWAAIIYSGGLSTGVAVVFWTQAVQRTGATHTAVYGNLVPVVALVGGIILLNEKITIMQVVGGIFIIGGLALMRRDRKKHG